MMAMLRMSCLRTRPVMSRSSVDAEAGPGLGDGRGRRGGGAAGALLEEHLAHAALEEVELGDPHSREVLLDVAVLEDVVRHRLAGERLRLDVGLVDDAIASRTRRHAENAGM